MTTCRSSDANLKYIVQGNAVSWHGHIPVGTCSSKSQPASLTHRVAASGTGILLYYQTPKNAPVKMTLPPSSGLGIAEQSTAQHGRLAISTAPAGRSTFLPSASCGKACGEEAGFPAFSEMAAVSLYSSTGEQLGSGGTYVNGRRGLREQAQKSNERWRMLRSGPKDHACVEDVTAFDEPRRTPFHDLTG